jgi:O-antigen/teichoic acid export membrane protein
MQSDRVKAADGGKLARVSLTGIGIRAVGAACGFMFNVILARTLGKADTGSVLLYLNFASMVGLIATGGMDVVGLRELARHADNPARVAAVLASLVFSAIPSLFLFSLGGFVFLLLCGSSLAGIGGFPIYAISVLVLALTALQKMLSDWLLALREFAASQLVFYFVNRVASLILIAGIVGVAMHTGLSGQTFIWVYAAGMLVAVACAILRISSRFAGRLAFPKWLPAMPLLRDGIACAAQNAAFILLNLSPFLLLGALSTPAEIGLFGISQRLVAVIILALTTISQFAMRDFSRAFATSDFGALCRTLTASLRLTFAAAIGLTIPLILLAPLWVLIFGKSFTAAAPALALLSAATCAQCLGMPFQAALLTTSHERLARNVTMACAAVGIALNALLIPHWGAIGAAMGTGVGLALQSIGHATCAMRVLPLRFHLALFEIIPRPARGDP